MRFQSRRSFVKTSVAVATGVSLASQFVPMNPLLAAVGPVAEPIPPMDDPRLKSLITRALDAAKSSGAGYADVRLTHTISRSYVNNGRNVRDAESITVGVRALTNGYWGFASGPAWTPDEMVRLGKEATLQAKVNSLGKERETLLAKAPVVADKHWTTPVKIDPFTVPPSQVYDMMAGIAEYANRRPDCAGAGLGALFWLQDKAFGSTEGSYCTQRLYRSSGSGQVTFNDTPQRRIGLPFESLSQAGIGYELFDEAALREEVDQLLDRARAEAKLPMKPVDVGRYDVLMAGAVMSSIVSASIGAATQLDRALGYEANAGGTSYLNDPSAMLGQYTIGNAMLNVVGDRTSPGGVATVAWDDEGVAPKAFPIVSNGVFVNYQTTREAAAWLRDASGAENPAAESFGCLQAPSAMDAPLAHTVNLSIPPASGAVDNTTLRANMKKGIEITNANIDTDFQQLNGYLRAAGVAFEINNGKRIARITGLGVLYKAPELWKSLTALGDASTLKRNAQTSIKGQPAQNMFHSVTVPSAVFEHATIVDTMRKA